MSLFRKPNRKSNYSTESTIPGVSIYSSQLDTLQLPFFIATLDVGVKNMCIRVELLYTCSEDIVNFSDISRENVFRELVWFDNILIGNSNTNAMGCIKGVDENILQPLMNYLSCRQQIGGVAIFVEGQMMNNPKASRIEQHILSSFPHICPPSVVGTINAKKKYSYFSIENSKTRKKEAVEVALSILSQINDSESISIIQSADKKDDLADTVLMMQMVILQIFN